MKKRPRLQFLDIGLITNALMLQGDMIGVKDLNDFYRGKIIQHLIARELISIQDDSAYKPHFWVREEKNSNAEVDIIYQYGKYVLPIEVKSGKQGSLKSLHQFVKRSNLPYYLGTQIHRYIGFLIKNFSE